MWWKRCRRECSSHLLACPAAPAASPTSPGIASSPPALPAGTMAACGGWWSRCRGSGGQTGGATAATGDSGVVPPAGCLAASPSHDVPCIADIVKLQRVACSNCGIFFGKLTVHLAHNRALPQKPQQRREQNSQRSKGQELWGAVSEKRWRGGMPGPAPQWAGCHVSGCATFVYAPLVCLYVPCLTTQLCRCHVTPRWQAGKGLQGLCPAALPSPASHAQSALQAEGRQQRATDQPDNSRQSMLTAALLAAAAAAAWPAACAASPWRTHPLLSG